MVPVEVLLGFGGGIGLLVEVEETAPVVEVVDVADVEVADVVDPKDVAVDSAAATKAVASKTYDVALGFADESDAYSASS